jgi:preprotein translocase subunit SecY
VFVAIIFTLFFGYHLFTETNQEPALSLSNAGGQIENINEDHLEKVLNYFSKREEKSNQILNSPSPVVDPSL